jgi:hypothetical protein
VSREIEAVRAITRAFPVAVYGVLVAVAVAVVTAFVAPAVSLAALACLLGGTLLGMLLLADRVRRAPAPRPAPRPQQPAPAKPAAAVPPAAVPPAAVPPAAAVPAAAAVPPVATPPAATPSTAVPPGPQAPAVPAKRRFATSSQPGDPQDRRHWTRHGVFGERFSSRDLDDFCLPSPPVAWAEANPFEGRDQDELRALAMEQIKWRHHHDIPELRDTEDFYAAYSRRVEAMLVMIDRALHLAGVDDPAGLSFVDIGAAEGYVTNWLLTRGVTDVDAIELNISNIERMWLVRALKGQHGGRVGRVDLERADWARALGRSYDVTLALGVIYHLENPLLFARNLFEATTSFAVVESDTPVYPDNAHFRGWGNIYLHRDQVTLEPGNIRYLTEMRPDRQALAEVLLAAGFSEVHAVLPEPDEPSPYFQNGEKSLLVAIR